MSVYPGGVEEVLQDVESDIQVACGEGTAGIHQWVMEVKVT